jgi:predicted ATPase with chaperone activity
VKAGASHWTTRVLCAARTIADLAGTDLIDTPQISEALQYSKREGE